MSALTISICMFAYIHLCMFVCISWALAFVGKSPLRCQITCPPSIILCMYCSKFICLHLYASFKSSDKHSCYTWLPLQMKYDTAFFRFICAHIIILYIIVFIFFFLLHCIHCIIFYCKNLLFSHLQVVTLYLCKSVCL